VKIIRGEGDKRTVKEKSFCIKRLTLLITALPDNNFHLHRPKITSHVSLITSYLMCMTCLAVVPYKGLNLYDR
jgi:hypothetical protein